MILRHSLVWLRSAPQSSEQEAELAAVWQEAGNPFIVCRTRPGEELSLGFCLPRDSVHAVPRRIAVSSNESEIEFGSRPPEIREIADKLVVDPELVEALRSYSGAGKIRIFGSHLWEVILGVGYTKPESDLDLVIDLPDIAEADAACEFLAKLPATTRLDAELSVPEWGEIHWKEWQSGRATLLVKSRSGVTVQPRQVLWGQTI